jgi:hypothetical protein
MLEISLSLVAGFAAYTAYTIAGDDIRANRNKQQLSMKPALPPKRPGKSASNPPKSIKPSSVKPISKKSKPLEPIESSDPIAVTAKDIVDYLGKNGPATLSKLAKELKSDIANIQLAAEQLVKDNGAIAMKRGGYPALALNN